MSLTSAGIGSKPVRELEVTVSCLAGQCWLREKCLTHCDQILEKLSDRNLTTFNVRCSNGIV